MTHNSGEIIERALGKLQIYIKPKDKLKGVSLMERLRPKQIYREIVKNAKAEGLMNASVYQTHSGFSLNDKIRVAHPELDNSDLALCVELIDEKPKLEAFCKNNAALLKGRMIVFKAVEFWDIK
ncbi:DUF190 domain-containing protein [Pontibacter sp. 172403-2]|uniref:DUF190 domain-containing protein n=1 Tax=Pontibacter rufus TaxID=2791028 RepID=UPI0018AF9741|nr:DUF190 domain-containing protein [Pontibacter sp. 172403-2]MBF9252249.1 DUF190 domain-containing protein [Pontibacter sp. 172403-2]